MALTPIQERMNIGLPIITGDMGQVSYGGITWARNTFQGAPVLYYELAVKYGHDDDGVNYIEPKFECGWDNQRHWNMGLEIKPTRSSVYEEEQAAFFINYRF